jgi:PAS domain S-box-containing protein
MHLNSDDVNKRHTIMNLMGKIDINSSNWGKCHVLDLPVLRKPDWYFQADNFSVRFEILNGNVLHGITSGKVKENIIDPSVELQENVVRSTGLDSEPYYYVLGLAGSSGASQKARKRYVNAILRFFKKYPFKLIIFYGSNRLLTAAINLAKPFVPFKVRVTSDLDKAMKLIAEEESEGVLPFNLLPIKNLSGENAGSKQIREYAEELLGYIEQINWEVDGISQIEDKDPDHPFHLVFEALKLVKWELDDLYQQRKSAEKALRKSEANFRKIVEASPMGMHMYKLEEDKRLVFTGSNPAADSILGIDNTQFVGKTIEKAFPPLRETEVPDRYCQVCIDGTHYRNEQIEYAHGQIKGAFEVHAFQTGPGMMATMFFDVTARKQAEDALRQSEERYKTLTNNLHVGIYRNTTGSQGRFIEANPAIVDMFGYQSRDEFKAINVADLYQNPDDREKFNKQIFKNGSVKKYEVKLKKKDGSPFIGSVSAVAVKDVDGEVKYYDGIIEDITGKKELEVQLQQSQKMEAIGTLAGGIAHDFNNILSAILGYTELAMIDTETESTLSQYLQEVFRAGERAKDLVKQILTFSRQAERERKPIQPKVMSKEVIKFLRASLPTTIEIRQEIQSDSLVIADPTQIHQLLMNLCTNAGHAMREKGGVLTVKLLDTTFNEGITAEHPELKPGPYIELTVSDTGYGIPAHMLDRIFDPFFTTKDKGEGTGLGLSVVHGIVGSNGGKIIASSEMGKGSTFIVYLPTVIRYDATPPQEGEPVPTGAERILFVDDEVALVEIGKHMLESLGYKITTRTSSVEALELFKSKADSFDLVITDMTMPNMTGDELARELLRIKPEIPVILCTGYSARINQQQASAMGIRAYVSKPVLRREIAATIRDVLGER